MNNLIKVLKFIINHPIGKRRKIKSLLRFFYWQIFSRIKIAKSVFNLVNDTKLNIASGQIIATGNYYVGLLEFDEMAFVSHFLNKNDVFFDIGTNIGTYTIIASGVRGATTFAFEPIIKTFDFLKKNIELNNLQNKVTVLNIGLAEKNGFLDFTKNLDSKNHIVNKTNFDTINVEVKTLDEFKQYFPSIIKVDVEGYEKFILKGADEVLKQNSLKCIVIEVNNEGQRYNVNENSIHELLTFYVFLCQYYLFERKLVKINILNSDNRIYVKDVDAV